MGINTIGFAISSKINHFNDIADRLNIIIDGPTSEVYFEEAISDSILEDGIYLTKLENGTLITTGRNFPFFGEDFSILSEHSTKFLKFAYGDTSGQYYFEYYENGKFLRSKYVSEGQIKTVEGNSLPMEFASFSEDELILEIMSQTCGEDIFTIKPNQKSLKYRYISGKPVTKEVVKPVAISVAVEDQKNNNASTKNRLIFLLVTVSIFLGISNIITSTVVLNKPFYLQITNLIYLFIFALMGYFLLKRKNWMRILVIVMYFISLPFNVLALKINVLLLNNILQFLLSTIITVILFGKDIKKIYTQRQLINPETNFEKISLKEISFLLLGVVLFQIGAADIIILFDLLNTGFVTGILSGILIVSGISILIITLKNNYHR